MAQIQDVVTMLNRAADLESNLIPKQDEAIKTAQAARADMLAEFSRTVGEAKAALDAYQAA